MSHIVKPVFSYLMFAVDLVRVSDCALLLALQGLHEREVTNHPLTYLVALLLLPLLPLFCRTGAVSFIKRQGGERAPPYEYFSSTAAGHRSQASAPMHGSLKLHSLSNTCALHNRRVCWSM